MCNNEAIVLGLILYSDSTELSKTGKRSAWPIMMSLANIPAEFRRVRGGFKLMGLFPEVQSVKLTALENANIFGKCLEKVLSPLKRLSYDGLEHNGQKCYPLLYAYVSDYPEGCKVRLFISVCQLSNLNVILL